MYASHPCASPSDESSEAHGWLARSEEHTSELQSRQYLVCRLLLEKKKIFPILSSNTSEPTQISSTTPRTACICFVPSYVNRFKWMSAVPAYLHDLCRMMYLLTTGR